MISTRNGLAGLAGAVTLLLAAGALSAQTTPPTPTTCSVAPTSIQMLSLERAVTISNLLSTITPNVPTNILAGIASGAQEIRTRLIYNAQANTITDTTFLVASGSPIPTPLATDVTQSTIQSYTMSIGQIYTSCKPTPSVLIVGILSAASGPYGNFAGAPAAISFGYTTDATPKITNFVELVAGQVVAYSAGAQGTLVFPAAPVTPPGSNAGAPTITLSQAFPASGVTQVGTNPYQVNAAASSDPNGLPLTFSWSSDKPANFVPSTSSSAPSIYFQSGQGDYTITLTVTNSAGVSASTKFVLEYVGRN